MTYCALVPIQIRDFRYLPIPQISHLKYTEIAKDIILKVQET